MIPPTTPAPGPSKSARCLLVGLSALLLSLAPGTAALADAAKPEAPRAIAAGSTSSRPAVTAAAPTRPPRSRTTERRRIAGMSPVTWLSHYGKVEVELTETPPASPAH